MNIYVSNLNFRTRGESLQTLFGEYGEVSSANIITDRETGRQLGVQWGGLLKNSNLRISPAQTGTSTTTTPTSPTPTPSPRRSRRS